MVIGTAGFTAMASVLALEDTRTGDRGAGARHRGDRRRRVAGRDVPRSKRGYECRRVDRIAGRTRRG